MAVSRDDSCFVCGSERPLSDLVLVQYDDQGSGDTLIGWCSRACMEQSIPSIAEARCDACGVSLTPTPEQLRALERWGNPLRRQPCLETENGLHVVAGVA